MTKEDLINFEEDIAEEFNNSKIKVTKMKVLKYLKI